MKIYKSILIFLAVAVISLSFCTINTFASETNVSIPEIGMSVSIPEDFLIITRDTPPSDQVFNRLGFSYDSLMDTFVSDEIFVMCEPADRDCRITVSMTEDNESKNYYNFKLLTEEQTASIQNSFVSQENCTSCTAFTTHPQAFFFCPVSKYVDNSGSHTSVAQYITIINGQRITIQLLAYEDDFSDEQVNALNSIVKSINFSVVKEKPQGASITGIIIKAIAVLAVLLLVLAFAYYFIVLKKKKNIHSDTNDNFEEFLSDTSIATWQTEITDEPEEPLVIIRNHPNNKMVNDAENYRKNDKKPVREPIDVTLAENTNININKNVIEQPKNEGHISSKTDTQRTSGVRKPIANRNDIFDDEIDPQDSYSKPKKAAVKTSGILSRIGKTTVHVLIAILFLFSLLISIIIKPFTKNKKRKRSTQKNRNKRITHTNRGSASASEKVRRNTGHYRRR